MKRLGAAIDPQAPINEGTHVEVELGAAARVRAAKLMQRLAPLVPLVAAQARDPAGVVGWVEEWARQIQLNQLDDEDLEAGMTAVGLLPWDQPFSFPWFLQAVRAARPAAARAALPPVRIEDLAGWTPEAQARGEELIAAMRARRGGGGTGGT